MSMMAVLEMKEVRVEMECKVRRWSFKVWCGTEGRTAAVETSGKSRGTFNCNTTTNNNNNA